jgi:hypothetical protein
MLRGKRRWLYGVGGALLILGCSSPKAFAPDAEVADPDVVRPPPGEPLLETIPGPMLGPFDSYQAALLAACNKIVKKPHATAGRKDHPQFDVRWRVSSEYCAWLYYTPDEKYVISKLTDQTHADPALRSKRCALPPFVDDPRYPPESIHYIYALHNHLYDDRISDLDIHHMVDEGRAHGVEAETKDGSLKLSMIAYFANSFEDPQCDGFYQYIPPTHQILKWVKVRGKWECSQTHRVVWRNNYSDFSVEQVDEPCARKGNP